MKGISKLRNKVYTFFRADLRKWNVKLEVGFSKLRKSLEKISLVKSILILWWIQRYDAVFTSISNARFFIVNIAKTAGRYFTDSIVL